MIIKNSYDIFISYRHNNATLIGELVQKLEKYYEVFWDQRLGSGYWDEQLEEAIKRSKAVVINFNIGSLKKNEKGEDWFYREIVCSMKDKAKENIIPVCYDGFKFPENLDLPGITEEEKEKLETLRDKHQQIIDLRDLEKIVEKIVEYLTKAGVVPRIPYEAQDGSEAVIELEEIAPVRSFCGRERELEELSGAVIASDVVFLSGMGGIGKTELAKKFMEEMTGSYRCVFCRYNISLERTLSEIKIKGCKSSDFEERKELLKKLLNENVLLVIDNFDFAADDDIDSFIYEFGSFACKKLITTRNSFKDIEFPWITETVTVGSLGDEELKALFEEKYTKKITDVQLEKILNITGRLTLAVPILASFCEKSGLSVDEMCEKAQKGLREFENGESVHYVKDGIRSGSVPEILRVLFSLEGMTENKKKTLCNLSLLQFMKVTKSVYRKFAFNDGKGNLNDFNELAATNWIKESNASADSETYYELHPLINELVKSDLKPSPITSAEVFGNFEKTQSQLEEKHLSSISFICGFLGGIELSVKENYDYLIKYIKRNKEVAKRICLILDDAFRSFLVSKETFDNDDVFLASFVIIVMGGYDGHTEFSDIIVRKCLEGRKRRKVSYKMMRRFSKKFLFGLLWWVSFSSSEEDEKSILFKKYKKQCARYLSLSDRLGLEYSLLEEKIFSKEGKASRRNVETEIEEAVRSSKSMEEALATIRDSKLLHELVFIPENLIDVVFETFLYENMQEEDLRNKLKLCLEVCYDSRKNESEKRDAKKAVCKCLLRVYKRKKLTFLSCETICNLLCEGGWNEEYSPVLAALVYGEEGKLYSALKSHLYAVPLKEKSAKALFEECEIIDKELDFYYAMDSFFDTQADFLFEYVDLLRETFGMNKAYTKAIIYWHRVLPRMMRNEKLREKAEEKSHAFENDLAGFALKDDE